MIDIHTHILPMVDDGSKSVQESLQMLKDAVSMGIDTVIFTPHYKNRSYELPFSKIKEAFNLFKEEVQKEEIPIDLLLGREIYYSTRMTEAPSGEYLTPIGNTNYCLLEFNYVYNVDVVDVVYTYGVLGYKVIIAHVERYKYLEDVEEVKSIRQAGALIQVNACGVVGEYGRKTQKLIFKLIKNGLVDFVASDVHSFRKNQMDKAYKIVKKKFGENVANELFNDNAKKLFCNK